ncbi:hypothetical protein DRH29_01415 [candidate division Kazan bacterium]|uniref:Uncharacterized protein n=1 Tax=candidate division Kazan bacterium TaxID=2202143 RepID=A0A420ZDV5_UNCK3|nr:MAG: hypothetical protein DRH29_01415 [candidate division Kazan bacterium]
MSLAWPIGNQEANKLDRQFILKRLSQIKATTMLDTGSARCELALVMAKQVGATEIHAIDIQTYDNECTKLDVHFTVGDLNKPFPHQSDYFDLVTSIHNIEHLTNTDGYLDEIYRVLKPGGLLMLETVNLAALHYRLMLFFGFLPNCLAPSKFKISPFTGEHPLHPHKSVFTYKALIEVARRHGFELISGKSHTIYPLPTFLGNAICKIWPNIGLFTSLLLRKPSES